MTTLNEAAAAAHELYLSYVEAGFTEEQALTIVVGLLKNAQDEAG